MANEPVDHLTKIAIQEKQFDALYRKACTLFDLPECPMWILYYLSCEGRPISQQELIEKMLFPKQTINSAVMYLAKHGWVELQVIPGTRNRKNMILTPAGEETARNTVLRMRTAEERAIAALGEEKTSLYRSLYQEFYEAMLREFQKEGLADGTVG